MQATRGERIVAVRHLLRLTQVELAEISGISQSYLSLMERGDRHVSDDVVHQISIATAMPSTFFDVAPTKIPARALTSKDSGVICSK